MDWSKGYSARYYLSVLDKATMRDVDRIELIGGTIKRSLTDIRESADVDCRNYDSKSEQYKNMAGHEAGRLIQPYSFIYGTCYVS